VLPASTWAMMPMLRISARGMVRGMSEFRYGFVIVARAQCSPVVGRRAGADSSGKPRQHDDPGGPDPGRPGEGRAVYRKGGAKSLYVKGNFGPSRKNSRRLAVGLP